MTIIIPSRNMQNVYACVQAIRAASQQDHIIIIDDGIEWQDDEYPWGDRMVSAIMGDSPFIFARNVNLGMEAVGDDDVLLLNDDALLQTQHGFESMAALTRVYPEYGIVGPLTNSTGNIEQMATCHGLPAIRTTHRAVPFLCAFIPRATINAVGLLDERFTTYGWEDTDYCRRVRAVGLKLGIYGGCFVDHLSLPSTFRGPGGVSGDIEPGRKIYVEKWGDDGI